MNPLSIPCPDARLGPGAGRGCRAGAAGETGGQETRRTCSLDGSRWDGARCPADLPGDGWLAGCAGRGGRQAWPAASVTVPSLLGLCLAAGGVTVLVGGQGSSGPSSNPFSISRRDWKGSPSALNQTKTCLQRGAVSGQWAPRLCDQRGFAGAAAALGSTRFCCETPLLPEAQ